MSIIQSNRVDLAIVNRIVEFNNERSHLSGGLSQHGGCEGRVILDKLFPEGFTGQGAVEPGTALHKFIQEELFPSGSVVNDTWLIIGHEQYIILPREEGKYDRRSPIDTLVFNLLTKEYEIWDYKSTRTEIKYLRGKPLKLKVKLQANMFGIQLRWQWRLPYYPVCRVLYFNKASWTKSHEYMFRCKDEYLAQSIYKIEMAEFGIANFEDAALDWGKFVSGMSVSSETKKPYRYPCRYCAHAPISERVLWKKGSKYGDKIGEIKEGEEICTGKCLSLLKSAYPNQNIQDFDDYIEFANTRSQ